MNIKTLFYLVILGILAQPSPLFAQDTGGDLIQFELRLLCSAERPGCVGIVHEQSGEPMFVEKEPFLTLEDIASAEAVLVSDPPEVVRYFEDAGVTGAGKGTHPTMRITFTAKGKEIFARVTADSVGRSVAVMMNGELVFFPIIFEPVSSGELLLPYPSVDEAQSMAARILQAKQK